MLEFVEYILLLYLACLQKPFITFALINEEFDKFAVIINHFSIHMINSANVYV